MGLPFTLEQLLGVFGKYNTAIWPMQVVAYLLGVAALFLAVKRTRYSAGIIGAILCFFWLWAGIGFCLLYFTQIYNLAYVLGVLSIIQAILFLAGVLKGRLSFRFQPNLYSIVGAAFVVYALAAYPIIGHAAGHGYPQWPPFGLVPCPTTVFTFGLLLWTDKRVPKHLLLIPLIDGIGGVGPASLGLVEDVGLVIAAVVGTVMIVQRDRKRVD
jgi:hypothetical protein